MLSITWLVMQIQFEVWPRDASMLPCSNVRFSRSLSSQWYRPYERRSSRGHVSATESLSARHLQSPPFQTVGCADGPQGIPPPTPTATLSTPKMEPAWTRRELLV